MAGILSFLTGRKTSPAISTSVMSEDIYDPTYFGMHQRALRSTMYGLGDIVRAVIEERKSQI
jgi:hypothetical protein